MKKLAAAFIAVMLLTSALPYAEAEAEPAPVRVAYFDCGEYYQPQPDGSVQSYDAAYLELIAEYTGLSFEYVDCGTWDNALQMLESREIDLLGTMQKNDGREEQYAMCGSSYGLTATELVALQDAAIGYEDHAAIGEARLGVQTDYVRMSELEERLSEYALSPRMLYFDTQEELFAALENGDVDIIAASSHTLSADWKVVEKFAYSKYYFATWKGNEALAQKLDDALTHTQLYRPDFQPELQRQYFPGLMQEPYSVAELSFIAALPVLNVYLNDGSQPLAYRDGAGNMTGILVELCEMIEAEIGLSFSYRALAGKDEPAGQTCVTVNCPDSGTPKQAFMSDGFFTADFNLYCRTGRSFEIGTEGAYRIVLPQNRQSFIDYLETTYPNCELVTLATPEECIRAVSSGRADLTMLNNYLVDNICKRKDIGNITKVPSRGIELGFVMICEGPDAEELANIISKGIARLDAQEINSIQFAYALNTQPDMTVAYFIKSNAVMVSIIAALLVAAICALVYVRLLSRKNAAIKKANAAKSDFLSTMSHDIRTPMNAIINIARLAQDELRDGNIEEVADDLRHIGTVSDFLMGLLNDVLDMSSIERGKFQLHPEVYEYGDFLKYIYTVFEPLCRDRNIRFVCEAGATCLPVYVDRVRFNQAFSNLLGNAVKFTPEGGTVTYRVTDNVVADGFLSCKFEISDTGCGMSEAFQKKMFEPFEREGATHAAYQGTGLGLSIAKSIITLMGGDITVKSAQGAGTSFFVTLSLPLATEEQKAAAVKTAAPTDSIAGRRVLIVEDNATNIIVLTRFLAKKDVITTVTKDGREAVELFAASAPGSFDMILMDLRMPVMDGYEATRLIRAMDRPDAKEIPILAMTADAFDNDMEATKAAGMNAHLTKPVVAETLYRALGHYCGADAGIGGAADPPEKERAE